METAGKARVLAEVTWRSLFRILVVATLALVLIKLWPLLKLLLVAILVAAALYPIVQWTCRRGRPRWLGLTLATSLLLVSVLGTIGLLVPVMVKEGSKARERLPELKEQLYRRLPPGALSNFTKEATSQKSVESAAKAAGGLLGVSFSAISGIVDGVMLLVVIVYLLIDGPRAIRWFLVFFRPAQRHKLSLTLEEVGGLVSAYVIGNLITSAICATYAFIVLSLLHVPMALLLAVFAGILDFIPVLGVIIALIPAMALGLTVSPVTAFAVLGLYCLYHLIENYFIIPRVYGRKLQISTLTVLLSIIIAGSLAGVVGAVVILPIVAAYPVFERHWLARKVPPEALEDHQPQRLAA